LPEISAVPFAYRNDPAVPAFDDSRGLFIFDGVCVLCTTGTRWLMNHDRKGQCHFTSAQSELGRSLYHHYKIDMDGTYLLIVNGRAYTASRGYIELCGLLGGWWKILRIGLLIPEPLRDWCYALIAKNRYRWFGKTEYCTLLTPEQRARLL
jgi:predicted DCC family thiol-disulfide oxidoreductase YuxK